MLVKMKKQQKSEKLLKVRIELTPPDTPKLNGKMERGFVRMWDKAKILMQKVVLKDNTKKKNKIIVKAIETATFLHEEYPKKA